MLLCIVLGDDCVAGINYGLNLLAIQIFDHGLDCEISHIVRVLSGGHGHLAIQDSLCSGDLSVAVISFTDMLSASAQKAMAKQGLEYAVAEADSAKISESIQAARSQGAQAVVVLLNWGKAGGKSPEKAQKALAWQIAEAGADLIIGAGSRVPQAPEWLSCIRSSISDPLSCRVVSTPLVRRS